MKRVSWRKGFVFWVLLAAFFVFYRSFLGAQTEQRTSADEISSSSQILNRSEFEDLVRVLAPRVNILRDIWALDPSVEFYGGTSRDFLYWVLGQFRGVQSRDALELVKRRLLAIDIIDARQIFSFESDIDLMSRESHRLGTIVPENYGLRKLDLSSFDRIDPTSELGQSEMNQGFIPVEKIRLSKTGLVAPGQLGDGVKEILSGQMSLSFPDPEKFKKSIYAKKGLNHPILIALRYLRILAQDFRFRHGNQRPELSLVLKPVELETKEWIKHTINDAVHDSSFPMLLEKASFKKWLSGSIDKAFRSYSNPTAAFMLFHYFGVDQLQKIFSGKIPSLHNYLLHRALNAEEIEKRWKQLQVSEADVLVPVRSHFKDGMIYHGAGSEEAFRSLIFQGAIPSTGGSADSGLYGVDHEELSVAQDFAGRGGDRNRVVQMEVLDSARIVDVSTEPGKSLFQKWKSLGSSGNLDQFAQDLGIDIILYPYSRSKAAVVKDRRALGKTSGLYLKLLSFEEIQEKARMMKSDESLDEFIRIIELNRLSEVEVDALIAGLSRWSRYDLLAELRRRIKKDAGDLSGSWSIYWRVFRAIFHSPERALGLEVAKIYVEEFFLRMKRKIFRSMIVRERISSEFFTLEQFLISHAELFFSDSEFSNSISDHLVSGDPSMALLEHELSGIPGLRHFSSLLGGVSNASHVYTDGLSYSIGEVQTVGGFYLASPHLLWALRLFSDLDAELLEARISKFGLDAIFSSLKYYKDHRKIYPLLVGILLRSGKSYTSTVLYDLLRSDPRSFLRRSPLKALGFNETAFIVEDMKPIDNELLLQIEDHLLNQYTSWEGASLEETSVFILSKILQRKVVNPKIWQHFMTLIYGKSEVEDKILEDFSILLKQANSNQIKSIRMLSFGTPLSIVGSFQGRFGSNESQLRLMEAYIRLVEPRNLLLIQDFLDLSIKCVTQVRFEMLMTDHGGLSGKFLRSQTPQFIEEHVFGELLVPEKNQDPEIYFFFLKLFSKDLYYFRTYRDRIYQVLQKSPELAHLSKPVAELLNCAMELKGMGVGGPILR